MSGSPAASPSPLSLEDRRWLHDKYERLGEEEGQLSGSRTSYFAAIAAVLVTGLVIATSNLLADPVLLVLFASFLSGLGILIAVVWAVLLHRTTDAQSLWREAARRLEELYPPVTTPLEASVSVRPGTTVKVDLSRPYRVHFERFSANDSISWIDRVDPGRLTQVMPLTLIGIWSAALVVVWVWFLVLR